MKIYFQFEFAIVCQFLQGVRIHWFGSFMFGKTIKQRHCQNRCWIRHLYLRKCFYFQMQLGRSSNTTQPIWAKTPLICCFHQSETIFSFFVFWWNLFGFTMLHYYTFSKDSMELENTFGLFGVRLCTVCLDSQWDLLSDLYIATHCWILFAFRSIYIGYQSNTGRFKWRNHPQSWGKDSQQ